MLGEIIPTTTLRAECPECATSYALARLGLKHVQIGVTSTVVCATCKQSFTFVAQSETIMDTEPAPIWRLWNRQPDVIATRTVYSTASTLRR